MLRASPQTQSAADLVTARRQANKQLLNRKANEAAALQAVRESAREKAARIAETRRRMLSEPVRPVLPKPWTPEELAEHAKLMVATMADGQPLSAESTPCALITALDRLGNCPSGYGWCRFGDGFRCGGGQHGVSLAALLEHPIVEPEGSPAAVCEAVAAPLPA